MICDIGRIICGLICIAFGVFSIKISGKGLVPSPFIGFTAISGVIVGILGVIVVIAAVRELILDINR